MTDIRTVAVAMSALELVPGEPSDLAAVLADPDARRALLGADVARDGLLGYLARRLDHGRVEAWEKRIEALFADGRGRAVVAGDDGYPPLLAACWNRPPVLFVNGSLAPDRPALAIVGSRNATEATTDAARVVAAAAAAAGASVVSGLAAGTDTAAHEGALSAAGHTVAVLGTGICEVFPEQNAGLAARISATGALVSQFAPDAPRTATTFLRRNTVIAGMAAVSVVMDGTARSGSRHQAEQAVAHGRPVLLWAPALAEQDWAAALVRDGTAAWASAPDDVLSWFAAAVPPPGGP